MHSKQILVSQVEGYARLRFWELLNDRVDSCKYHSLRQAERTIFHSVQYERYFRTVNVVAAHPWIKSPTTMNTRTSDVLRSTVWDLDILLMDESKYYKSPRKWCTDRKSQNQDPNFRRNMKLSYDIPWILKPQWLRLTWAPWYWFPQEHWWLRTWQWMCAENCRDDE